MPRRPHSDRGRYIGSGEAGIRGHRFVPDPTPAQLIRANRGRHPSPKKGTKR